MARKFIERQKKEFEQKIIDIRRVARIVAGGRRFSFRVTVVAGNRRGEVGVGLGKAGETSTAIEKAYNNALKHKIKIATTKDMSIPHEVKSKFGSSRIIMKPSPRKGLVAGSSVKSVLDLAGIRDVNAKILSRSKNKLNIARAAVLALSKFR
ncbi:MAG TPA: 30S ribosomal protein S5 [Candidatus Paceibacterota bacterium]